MHGQNVAPGFARAEALFGKPLKTCLDLSSLELFQTIEFIGVWLIRLYK
jgi:hypothetical protein